MDKSPLLPRHYPKITGLAARTQTDKPAELAGILEAARPYLRGFRDARPADPSLVSSAHGSIAALLLTIPSYAVEEPLPNEENPLAAIYKDLLTKLPPATQVVIVTHEASTKEIKRWMKSAGLGKRSTVLNLPDHLNFSVWAEDGYVTILDQATGQGSFVEPFEFPRYADALVADFVANNSDYGNTQAPLYFQGGNLLIGDSFFMIGADYPANSLRYIDRVIIPEASEEPADTVRRLYHEYLDRKREMLVIGSTIPVPEQSETPFEMDGEEWTEVKYFGNHQGTQQPMFHIDMFMTLAGRSRRGRYRVLVGDPKMAARILKVPLWPHSMSDVFDDIAHGLKKLGFTVIRNPLPLAYVDDPDYKERLWYFATSNNAMVQVPSSGQKIAWLPTYGHGAWTELAATDRKNKEIWERLGFEVRLLGDFHPLAANLGALHCIKKYLKRI